MVVKSLFFFLTEALFLILFLLCRKTEKRESFLLWITLAIISLMSLNAFVQGVLNLLHLPVGILSMSVVLIFVDAFLAVMEQKGRQTYSFDRYESIFLLALCAIVLIFWIVYFGPGLSIRFASVDASVHARYGKLFAFHHQIVTNLFFSGVNDGLLMEALCAFSGTGGYYHTFVFMRIVDLLMSGLVFYACAEPFFSRKPGTQIILLIITMLYMVGYPLYGVIFGFAYYLAVIMLAGYLYLILREETDPGWKDFMLGIGLFGTFVSYTMLVPVIWIFVLENTLKQMKRRGRLFTSKNLIHIIAAFGIPTAFGMMYAWVNLKEVNPSSGAIINAGGAYFSLFSNFILLIPFLTGEAVYEVKNRKVSLEMSFLLWGILYWVLFYALYRNGNVSQYYFSKLYNLLWLCIWIVCAKCIGKILDKKKSVLAGYLLGDVCLFGFCAVYNRIHGSDENQFVADIESVLNIDVFNAYMMKNVQKYPDDLIHLFEQTSDLKTIYSIAWATEDKGQWYITFTGSTFYYPREDVNEYISWANGTKSEYFCVTYEKANEQNLQILEKMGNVIYRNTAGEIIQRKDQ